MSYLVLARKWRPKNFTELVGQQHVVKALSNALEQNRLHHAYLFTGTRGVGKTTLARILAKSLNCEKGISAQPCCACDACLEIDAGRFIDLLEFDAASNTGIDNMREILDNAQYAPVRGRFKVYLIDEVHMLSKASFNSMLKTLEEPPAHIKFILATTDPQKIPVTVLSRCLQFNLKQMSSAEITERLQHVLKEESIHFEVTALKLIAYAAQGSMRDALSLLDQAIAYGNGQVREQDVRGMLGTIDQDYLYGILTDLAKADGPALIARAEEMAQRGLSLEKALQDLTSLLHQIALAQTVPQAISEDLPARAALIELAQAISPEQVQLYYQIALHGKKEISLAPDEYAGFSMALLRMLAFTPEAAAQAQNSPSTALVNAEGTGKRSQLQSKPVVKGGEVASVSKIAAHEASTQAQFDGDWISLVKNLKLNGMAKMLAQHSELKNYTANSIELCLHAEHKHLLEKSYQEKLKTALDSYFGKQFKIIFTVEAGTGNTLAKLEDQQRQVAHAGAVAAIEDDPFVQELIQNLDAQIVESSVKPIQ